VHGAVLLDGPGLAGGGAEPGSTHVVVGSPAVAARAGGTSTAPGNRTPQSTSGT